MGVDTGCMLIVGLPADEQVERAGEELRAKIHDLGFYDVLSEDGELGLAHASPYYDAPDKERVWGVRIAGDFWDAVEVDIESLPGEIAQAQAKFKDKTGLDGNLYVSPHVT